MLDYCWKFLFLGGARACAAPTIKERRYSPPHLAWAVGGLGMGFAYPASTLTALGLAADGQEGNAAASLQVAETIGTATGTGAAAALFTGMLRIQPLGDLLVWPFLLGVGVILLALLPALRLAPSARSASSRADGARLPRANVS